MPSQQAQIEIVTNQVGNIYVSAPANGGAIGECAIVATEVEADCYFVDNAGGGVFKLADYCETDGRDEQACLNYEVGVAFCWLAWFAQIGSLFVYFGKTQQGSLGVEREVNLLHSVSSTTDNLQPSFEEL